MKIAVNTRFLLADYMEGYGYFISETMRRITRNHPEHEFLFIFDRPFDNKFLFSDNVSGVVCPPPARHPLLWKLWYDVKVPAILKRYRADIFVSPDGFCSLRTDVPQAMVLHDLAFLHYPAFNRRSHLWFYKHYTAKFLQKAKSVATVSQFSKKDIQAQYNIAPEKIDVVYSGVKEIFVPLPEEEKEKVKHQYCYGREYFLYTGAIHPRKNLIQLLKAFSLFKKRQRSSMRLVLTGRLAWKYESFLKDLESYKYRDEVLLTSYISEEEVARITAAAYAMVYPSLHEGFGVPVLEAMRCAVPVITSRDSSMQEIAGSAALYADPGDPASIAEQMMLVYKDETMRQKLIEKGRERVREFSWDRSAELLWNCILRAGA